MALSVPTVKVNNDILEIVPNSYSYTTGRGTTNVRAASRGGTNSRSIHTKDAESQFSKITFSLFNTKENQAKVAEWQANTGLNTVDHFQIADDIAESFQHVSVTNDPDFKAAADAVVAIEMAGDKLPD